MKCIIFQKCGLCSNLLFGKGLQAGGRCRIDECWRRNEWFGMVKPVELFCEIVYRVGAKRHWCYAWLLNVENLRSIRLRCRGVKISLKCDVVSLCIHGIVTTRCDWLPKNDPSQNTDAREFPISGNHVTCVYAKGKSEEVKGKSRILDKEVFETCNMIYLLRVNYDIWDEQDCEAGPTPRVLESTCCLSPVA